MRAVFNKPANHRIPKFSLHPSHASHWLQKRTIFFTLLCILLCIPGCAQTGPATYSHSKTGFSISLTRWPEAERMFHSDPRWLGGDGASSVDLGNERILWLFGDSFINTSGTASRHDATLVRNTIAIQNGYDPRNATMHFFWKYNASTPTDFFPHPGTAWYWPTAGTMVDKHLLLFFFDTVKAPNKLGFQVRSWKAVYIDNPHENPESWHMVPLICPQPFGLVITGSNPIVENNYLIACASDPHNFSVYLLRWKIRDVRQGILSSVQWWTGNDTGWNDNPQHKPKAVFTQAQMEFSLEFREDYQRYFQIQTRSMLNPCLSMAHARQLQGPWSSQTCFFDPPEQFGQKNLIYAGKSHGGLRGADITCSYVVNSLDTERLLTDMSLYYPLMFKGKITPVP